MDHLLFNAIFFTLLLFCAFLAFAQWRLTRDKVIPYYIGYLLFVFGHYFRQFCLAQPSFYERLARFNPPLKWDMPLSFAASACYLFFIWLIMAVPGDAPRHSRLLTWAAGLYAGMIALNLFLQAKMGPEVAIQVHHIARLLLYVPMLWMSFRLLRMARLPYQKFILAGSVTVTLGFVEVIATGLYPHYHDLLGGAIRHYETAWPYTYWYHLKVGIALDVFCFS